MKGLLWSCHYDVRLDAYYVICDYFGRVNHLRGYWEVGCSDIGQIRDAIDGIQAQITREIQQMEARPWESKLK